MTWVIGTPTMMGYGLVIGDIQVTVPTPNGPVYIDGIQKVFPVGRFIAAGFAGNVAVGYRLIDDLMQWLRFPPTDTTSAWMPPWVIAKWRRRARWLYPSLATSGEEVGLVVSGVSPQEDNGIPGMARTYAWILRSPSFEPKPIEWMKVGAIGRGNQVEQYRQALENVNEDPVPYYQGEVGGAQGMFATTLAHMLGNRVERTPEPGISPHLLICTVRRGAVSLWTNDYDVFEEGGKRPALRMPPIARTWPEVVALLERNGLAESQALEALA
jgi:hypothetical protein